MPGNGIFKRIPICYGLLALLIASCKPAARQPETADPNEYKESLIKANKQVVLTESEQIDDYISRHGWKTMTTSTGLRYWIYEHGNGQSVKPGNLVNLNYCLTLLTGDTIYSSRNEGPLVFKVGMGQVISGLEEAILLLKVGDRAKIIIPSHLAFGLIGDQNKINHKASLVYDLEFVSIDNP